jgi:hypothetical protein
MSLPVAREQCPSPLHGSAERSSSKRSRSALGCPNPVFGSVSWLVDEGDAASKESATALRSLYHLTLLYMPSANAQSQTERTLMETGRERRAGRHQELALHRRNRPRPRSACGFAPEVQALDTTDSDYLHGTISTKRHPSAF